MDQPLANRLALVTGASKGIGAATARALAAAGAHVVLTGRDVPALEGVEDAIHAVGGASTIAPVDLAESDGLARLASAIAGRWDKLDYLVISAAYLPALTPVTQIDGKQFSQAVTTNLLATQALLAISIPCSSARMPLGSSASPAAWARRPAPIGRLTVRLRPRSTTCLTPMRRK